ncbi:thioesterase-like superfamily-domain-containing protein [Vararia minispora EC-137]|uniref:Thioesterase-like superfamily-domain-containing protein n=1 Tax=Vararia minispora EC-137 TaxID=1314806 RepID=A0ACB8Q905_9AGAM|nr:thioesterase-like superfamily-domain-containing protein [Vararia minispora EC-137]
MAPFSEATRVRRAETREDSSTVYVGTADTEWSIGAVPHGGYVLALVLNALIAHQTGSTHPDPIHITAHFLRSTSPGPFSVRVKLYRVGRVTANLGAELWQAGTLRVTTHAIFSVLDTASAPDTIPLTLAPPAPYARLTPFRVPPARTPVTQTRSSEIMRFAHHLVQAREPSVAEHQAPANGAELGEYWSFEDPAEPLTPAALALFADLFPNVLPRLVRESRAGGKQSESWHPTLVLSLEFKFPVPRDMRVIGSFAASRFVNDPNARHDVYVELWTAPGEIGSGRDERRLWREEQRCVAVAHQTAMLVPWAANQRRAKM